MLSPAYDLVSNPAPRAERRLSMGCAIDDVGRVTRAFTRDGALRAAPGFGLGVEEALGIVQEVESGVAAWREVFSSTGMSARELDVFGRVIEGMR